LLSPLYYDGFGIALIINGDSNALSFGNRESFAMNGAKQAVFMNRVNTSSSRSCRASSDEGKK